MGVFGSIKKIGKKIVKGVKKVFKKVMKVVTKILNSKIGKVLMLAATIVTAGAALYGAYAGMTGALGAANAAGSGFAQTFTAGFKGTLAGLKTGMSAGTKALGQMAKLNMSGAGNTLMGVGNAARTAGAGVVQGLGQAAKGAANVASAAGSAPGVPAPDAVPAGGVAPAASPVSTGSIPGSPLPGPQSHVIDAAKTATDSLVSNATSTAQTAGQTMQEGLLKELIAGQNKAATRQLWGNIIMEGGKAVMQGQEETPQEYEERMIRRGWTRDSGFDPLAYI